MTKIYVAVLPLLILFCFSCRKEIALTPGFELSATSENNSVVLNWSPVLLSGFKSINIYRSVSPIPDPLFNKPIDASLLIGTVTDKTSTTFKDSNLVLGSGGVVYYKIVMNLTDRVIPSNEVQTSLDGFSIIYNSKGFASNAFITPFPEKNMLYLVDYNISTISLVDYSQKRIIKSAIITQNMNNMCPVINSGNAELFVRNNLSITCYDGLTLMSKYVINLTAYSLINFKVKDNYMYVLYMSSYNTAKIRTYDLSTQLMVGEKTVYTFTNGGPYGCNLYIGSQTNKILFKYYEEIYNPLGFYVIKSVCVNYNIVNHVAADSAIISHPLLNADSISNNNNFYNIQLSQDGNYLSCNEKGDILSLSDNSLQSVKSGSNVNPRIVYSNTGNYLLAKPANVISSNLIDVYSLPNFNLVMSLKSPNPQLNQSSSSMLKDDILDNDSLVSYNLKNTFANNQTKSVLTVFFKKFD